MTLPTSTSAPLFAAMLAVAMLIGAARSRGDEAQPGRPLARIALVSDTHTNRNVTDPDQGRYKAHLEQVIAQVNEAKVDVVLIAGDLTQGGRPEEIDDFLAQIEGFKAPARYVAGNHDVGDKHLQSKPGEGISAARLTRFEKRLGPSWWSADVGSGCGVRVIGINSSLLGSGLPAESAQWSFLEAELARPAPKPTLLLMHYPPFLKTPDEPGGGYWNIEPAPRERLLALAERPEAHVIGILTGHLHRHNEAHAGHVRIVTTPPVSFGLPQGKQPEGWTLVTVLPDGSFTTEFHAIH